MKIRVHHMLCAPLFVGKGYSEEFVDNMQTIVDSLHGNEEITLQIEPDVICNSCPNYLRDVHQCELDQNHVKTKDADLVEKMTLDVSKTYKSRTLFAEIRDKMTKEIFEQSCHRCDWYQQGLCSFEKYMENIERF